MSHDWAKDLLGFFGAAEHRDWWDEDGMEDSIPPSVGEMEAERMISEGRAQVEHNYLTWCAENQKDPEDTGSMLEFETWWVHTYGEELPEWVGLL